jgi:transposase-like protein
MLITVEINCPLCHSGNVSGSGKQNFICKKCGHQFIGGRERTYRGACPLIKSFIKIMLVCGTGIRDIDTALGVSVGTEVLKSGKYG